MQVLKAMGSVLFLCAFIADFVRHAGVPPG